MTQPGRVVVKSRRDGPTHGFTTVHAEVDGGVTGDYIVASKIVGTQAEVTLIREMSERRMEAAEATKAGMS